MIMYILLWDVNFIIMQMNVIFLYNEKLYQLIIEPNKTFCIGSQKKADLRILDFTDQPIFIKWTDKGVRIKTKNVYRCDLDSIIKLNTVLYLNESTLLYFSSFLPDKSINVKLPYDCSINIGREENNDIVIDFPFVSSKHFVLKRESGTVRIEDNNSSNGTFLNGQRVKKAVIKSGDVISLLSVNIILENGELHFQNVGKKLTVNIDKNRSKSQQFSVDEKFSNILKYKRSPRAIIKLPSEEIVLSAAPSKGITHEKSRGMLSSFFGTGAMVGASLLTGVYSPALMAARTASLVSPIVGIASSRKNDKKRKKSAEEYELLRQEKYGAYIEDQKAKIEAVADKQRDILLAENPNPSQCIAILYNLYTNLWERIPSDHDFMNIRIGMGYEKLCVNVKYPHDANSFQMENDEVKELSNQIIEETRIVDKVPARINLLDSTVGFVGYREKTIQLIKNIIIFLTVTHCYEEVKIVGLFDEKERSVWSSLRWLPHLWNNSKSTLMLAFGEIKAHSLLDSLSSILMDRVSRKNNNNSNSLPYYLFILGGKDILAKNELAHLLEKIPTGSNISSMFLFDDMSYMPNECKMIVNVDEEYYYEVKNSGEKKFFTPDQPVSDKDFELFTRRMSAVCLESNNETQGMPDKISFLEGYGVKELEELNVIERWKRSKPFETLAAPIGVLSNGKTFCFDIHQKKHGPHGVIGGSPGSGKSEFLRTWILSMALNYHPNDVSFVIIDYKGGGLADFIEPLPHISGVITDIGNNISRSLISLSSENKRREEIFKEANKSIGYEIKDIYQYQKLYRRGLIDTPLPHLIIIVDEFAELKKDRPEFMDAIVSISRIGRSLGVHLVLTTQNPGTAVSAESNNNIFFRICLKVTDVSVSKQVIGTTDAALLTTPGRAYMAVGSDLYVLFQSYYSMGVYETNAADDTNAKKLIHIVNENGERIGLRSNNNDKNNENSSEMTKIVNYIIDEAKKANVKKPAGPWLPELPDYLTADELVFSHKANSGLSLPVGLFDIPIKQMQGTFYIDLESEGNYAIYGAPGTGKTTLLKTIVAAMGRYYTPDDVSLYILDFGGWGMSVFSSLPHVGDIALDCEEEKFPKLIKLINDEFENRKRLFFSTYVSSIKSYRETTGKSLPSVVVVVDNIVPSFELYPDLEALFVRIAREGLNYGIHLIYTANSTQGVKFKIVQSVQGTISFELTDSTEYVNTIGRIDANGIKALEKVGRAMVKSNPPIEIQIAEYMPGRNDKDRNDHLKEFADNLNNSWNGFRPKPIPVIPEHIDHKAICKYYRDISVIPLGLSYETTEPDFMDLSNGRMMLITGGVKAGKSRMLGILSKMIHEKFPEAMFIVFDGQENSLREFGLESFAKHYSLYTDHESISSLISEISEEFDKRQKCIRSAKKSGERVANFTPVCIIIDDICECMRSMNEKDFEFVEKLSSLPSDMGVITVAAGRYTEVEKNKNIDTFIQSTVRIGNGLALGGTPADYASLYSMDIPYSERGNQVGNGNGLLFSNGCCHKIKLIE